MGVYPDILAVQKPARSKSPTDTPKGVLTAPPQGLRKVVGITETLAARANRITVRHRLGDLICVIEIVSPGNKSGKAAMRSFIQKSVDLLHQGIHLLVIDLFPPTARDPFGIHKAIWDEFQEEDFDLPADKRLILAAYVAGDLLTGFATTAYYQTVGVGDHLPDMPAYLDRKGYVNVPLESTYQATWDKCPDAMRELVETGKLAGEEE